MPNRAIDQSNGLLSERMRQSLAPVLVRRHAKEIVGQMSEKRASSLRSGLRARVGRIGCVQVCLREEPHLYSINSTVLTFAL